MADECCGRCGEPALYAVGESLRDGENAWFLERWCRSCGEGPVEFGRGFVPEALRERFLELTGRWRLRVDHGSDADVAVLRFVRRVYDLSIGEARERRAAVLAEGLRRRPGRRSRRS